MQTPQARWVSLPGPGLESCTTLSAVRRSLALLFLLGFGQLEISEQGG